jgi:low affinity Fe/Cu permease
MRSSETFTRFAKWTAHAAGQPLTFAIAVGVLLIWALTGPIFQFNDTWQLVINTGTTIITFLMVFLIQNTQNRDAVAVHLKLDELIRAMHGARNRLMDLEDLTEEELEQIRERYVKLAEHAKLAMETRKKPPRKAEHPEKESGR